MIKPLLLYFPLTLLSLSLCVACEDSTNQTQSFSPKKLQLEKAVSSVEMTLSSIGDVGYVQWTPTTAAEELVNSLNASQVLVPGEDNSTIKVEGYGSNLDKPLLVKNIPCCQL